MVWLILLITAWNYLSEIKVNNSNENVSWNPIRTVKYLTGCNENAVENQNLKVSIKPNLTSEFQTIKSERGIAYYFTILLLGLVLGYIIKPVIMAITRHLAFWRAFHGLLRWMILRIWHLRNYKKKCRKRFTQNCEAKFRLSKRRLREKYYKQYTAPFNSIHRDKPYFKELVICIRKVLDENWDVTGKRSPFSTGKRLLKSINNSLWEECERLEAEVRMISAIYLASLFNMIAPLIILLIFVILSTIGSLPEMKITFFNFSDFAITWLIISFPILLLLLWGVRLRIRREVQYVYLCVLIAIKIYEKEKETIDIKNYRHN
ncbi:MAG: hypothetical protein GY855_09195 [candidate division Zixibacteria bacterium]|nr:hypothetical protein [candidate division Zixibacteria bacterium]